MTDPLPVNTGLDQGDGTSQAGRVSPDLDPDGIRLDGRSTRDLIAFIQGYAGELIYEGPSGPAGYWDQLLPADLDPDAAAAWLADPASASPPPAALLARPHRALLLAFLALYRHVQDGIDGLTRRHLDFYYRQVLGFAPRPGVPDRVHLLAKPASGVARALIPKGTLLDAGKDSAGAPVVFATERELVANQAVPDELKVVYVQQEAGKWLNLYTPDDPITAGDPAQAPSGHWKTFGQDAPARYPAPTAEPPAVIGWALASPLLALAGGERTLTLSLGFDATGYDALDQLLPASDLPQAGNTKTGNKEGDGKPMPFLVEIATCNGWTQAPASIVTAVGTKDKPLPWSTHTPARTMQVSVTLAASAPALVAPPDGTAALPAVRLLLKPHWDDTSTHWRADYPTFRALSLTCARVDVRVSGLTPARLWNDHSALDPAKPCEPFGSQPAGGARLRIAHPELNKGLDSVRLDFAWMGAPDNLQAYYKHYPEIAPDTRTGPKPEELFRAWLSLADGPQEDRLPDDNSPPLSLFALHELDIKTLGTVTTTTIISGTSPQTMTVTSEDHSPLKQPGCSQERCLIWTLAAPDFQHANYPGVASRKAIELAAKMAAGQGASVSADDYLVNPPYTPKLQRLVLGYSAGAERAPGAAATAGANTVAIYHCHPFGMAPIAVELVRDRQKVYRLLPRYDNEGELYIGLRGLEPPQNLALLFQLAEGSADPDPPPVAWDYLDGNDWKTLMQGRVLNDDTEGLLTSGIVELALPAAATGTRLPPDRYWLRVCVPSNSAAVCATIAIRTQAVAATFVDHGNAPDRLVLPLPAGTVKSALAPIPGLAALVQPYSSFGGRPPESPADLYTRASERLRHRARALSPWDYERLVLERFPDVYKVKCLPAGSAPDQPLGEVRLILVGNLQRLPSEPFAPRVSAATLRAVEAYLADKLPGGATVRARNPRFIPVLVWVVVRFVPGADRGFYCAQLNEDLCRFLSPWAYDPRAEIVFGGRIHNNQVIDRVQRLPYVEYTAGARLMFPGSKVRNRNCWVSADGPDAILVSAPQHRPDVHDQDIPVDLPVNYNWGGHMLYC